MNLYIYNVDTNEIAEIIEGEDNQECEMKASDANYDQDLYGWSYTANKLRVTKDTIVE